MSTILFDSARTSDLLSPLFGVPPQPASIHDDIPQPCAVCEVVHLPAHRSGPDRLDIAHEQGRSIVLFLGRMVTPPSMLEGDERAAFVEGAESGLDELHRRLMDEAMRAEVDAEMASVYAGR